MKAELYDIKRYQVIDKHKNIEKTKERKLKDK